MSTVQTKCLLTGQSTVCRATTVKFGKYRVPGAVKPMLAHK